MNKKQGKIPMIIFGIVLIGGIGWAASQLLGDLFANGRTASTAAYAMLALALLIALGFEFVNGFHDTANAVATVIYTHSLEPHIAVMWSGMWNLIGVLLSSGAVAFAVVSLLPVELILESRLRRGLCHGIRPAGVRHYLEPEYLVVRICPPPVRTL